MRLTTVLTVAALMSGCSNPTYHQGLGRPEYNSPPRRLPLSIALVYVNAADPADRFALLVNAGTIAATGLTLVGPAGSVTVPEPIPAGGELRVSLASLAGSGVFGGELAATSADGLVQAYLAWGIDPFAAGSLLAAAAYQSGATEYGAFVPAGFPSPTGLAFVSTAAGVGCAAPSATVAGLSTPEACPTTAGVLALRGVVPALDGATDSTVTLRNLSAAAVDLFGVRLCQTASCTTIVTDVVVPAGGDQVLHVGATTASVADPTVSGAPIAGESELAVLAPGTDLTATSPTLQAYAHWGSVAPRFADAATTAGLWPARDAQGNVRAAEAVRVPGEILVPVADPALSAPAWAPAAPRRTDPATDPATLPLGPTADLWTTCSTPRRYGPQPRPTLVLSAVEAAGGGWRLHFTNRDATTGPAVPLSAITVDVVTDDGTNARATTTLALGATVFAGTAVPDLAPGSTLVVELAGTCPAAPATPCLVGPTLTARGELAVRVSGAMVQYLATDATPNRVGVPAAELPTRNLLTEALAANLWPGSRYADHERDCAVALPAAGSTLNLDLALDGRSPPDWQ